MKHETFMLHASRFMHIPVLLKETIEILDPQIEEFFIDGTIGGAGHSKEILKRIGPTGKLLGIDWDEEMIKIAEENIKNYKNAILVHSNYTDLPQILKKKKLPKADGLFLDLGFSSPQIDEFKKGFSFMKDEPLDMCYDADMRNEKLEIRNLTAAEAVNQFPEKELADIIFKYGEEKFSRQIAKKIIKERRKKRILTTFDLVEIIKKAVPKSYERGRIHPATRTFQALRIYVNNELENLENLLKNIDKIVKSEEKPSRQTGMSTKSGLDQSPSWREGGRIAIISFHSLEDRLIKNYFRAMAKEGKARILTKKPITPTQEEIKQNPRSRSAKLRAIQL